MAQIAGERANHSHVIFAITTQYIQKSMSELPLIKSLEGSNFDCEKEIIEFKDKTKII